MKICLAVCEYNPFHNGHARHIQTIRDQIKPDYLCVIMSGSFTQRGEIALLDKYTRARHACYAGADMVFELPTVFSTGNAEIFAKGAIKLLKELPGEKVLCFGAESGDEQGFLQTAKMLNEESKDFKKALKSQLKEGVSLAKAKLEALKSLDIDADLELLKSPNNILGIEYTRAILSSNANVSIYPILRSGAGYSDDKMYDNLSSATAIRKAIFNGERKKIKSNVPKFVYKDLPKSLPNADDLIFYSLLKADKSFLKSVCDCTEGLENRIKACLKNSTTLDELKSKIITKRYTSTRVNRILTACLLGITEDFIKKCMRSELYLNVLAVKGEMELLSYIRKNCKIPLITRKNDLSSLSSTAISCFEKDALAGDIFGYLTGQTINEFMMIKA